MKRILNFIGGEFVEPATGRWLTSDEPGTGLPFLEVPDSDARDVDRAVAAARRAFPQWSAASQADRAAVLLKLADLIDRDRDALAEAESQDQGKPVALAREMDIPRAAQNFRFFANAILHAEEIATRPDAHSFNYVVRQPLGVAGLISPWNLPLYLLTWKIAPALACGNAAVCKPSELTSLTAAMLCELAREAGVPPGILNVVFGAGASAGGALVAHPDVPLISFTGGTATGRAIALAAAPAFKRVSLELGGKNANVIFADCDFERALATTVRSSFLNQGEICLCGSRIFVERPIYERFASALAERAKALKVGDRRDPSTFMGALVSRDHLEKVRGYLDVARADGGRLLAGGDAPAGLNGFYLNPAVIADLPATSRLWREEIFGPVVTIAPFDDEDEAVARANETAYGLSATLWTVSLARAHRVAERLQAGTVWVNAWMQRDLRAPFGGVKASGVGREGGSHSLDFYSELKTICVRHQT